MSGFLMNYSLKKVERQFIKKLQRPYSECVDDLESLNTNLYKIFVASGKLYRQDDCFGLCYQTYVLKKCGCQDPAFYSIPNEPICITLSNVSCNLKAYLIFYGSNNIKTLCEPECPLECESQSFGLSVSTSGYPTEGYAYQLTKLSGNIWSNVFPNISQVTQEELKERTLSLSVYYGEMKYISIEELQKTNFLDLIASVGGTLGLFLGMSFLSFFEIFDVVIEAIYIMAEHRMQMRKIIMVQPRRKSSTSSSSSSSTAVGVSVNSISKELI